MTTAAIYARKSTDQGSVADESKSVTRQIDHARQYAAGRGWSVDDACIYVDDGISGAEFARRPGFVRLMAALKPRPPFQVLIMSEESRLGREAIETAFALKQLVTAGVRVFFYMEDRERTLDSPTDKIMLSLTAFADELEREKARHRVTDAMVRKARAGHVTGGRVFGYDNVEILDAAGRRSHVERRINDAEAATVRRIFELAAEGVGQKRIALRLNADDAPSPRSQQDRPRGWAQSSVHEVLFRDMYRGELVWNRTRKRDRWGQKNGEARPAADWIRKSAPELRIVPEELWQAAHTRIAESRTYYDKATHGTRQGRPRGVESKYLLPGFARCGCCNGGLHVRSMGHSSGEHRRRAFFYACTAHYNRGPEVCPNVLKVRMEVADAAVLEKIGEILTPDMIPEVIARVRELMAPDRQDDHRNRVAREIATIETQIANLTDAVAMGGDMPTLVTRLQKTEQRRQELARTVQALGDGPVVPRVDWRRVEEQARSLLTNWRGMLTRQVAEGREVLRQVLLEPIRFTPFEETSRRGYRFAGVASIAGLFGGVLEVIGLASPHGSVGSLPALALPIVGELEHRRAA